MLAYELKTQYGDMMKPTDAAKVLRLHPAHVRELCREGKLPAVKIGDRWRIPTAKFATIIEGFNE